MARGPATAEAATRRRVQRFKVRELTLEAPIDAVICDVSDEGLGVEAAERLRVGVDYIFRVRRGSGSLKLPGRVEWCRLVETRRTEEGEVVPVYRAGVALSASQATGAWRKALANALAYNQARLELQEGGGPVETGAEGGQ